MNLRHDVSPDGRAEPDAFDDCEFDSLLEASSLGAPHVTAVLRAGSVPEAVRRRIDRVVDRSSEPASVPALLTGEEAKTPVGGQEASEPEGVHEDVLDRPRISVVRGPGSPARPLDQLRAPGNMLILGAAGSGRTRAVAESIRDLQVRTADGATRTLFISSPLSSLRAPALEERCGPDGRSPSTDVASGAGTEPWGGEDGLYWCVLHGFLAGLFTYPELRAETADGFGTVMRLLLLSECSGPEGAVRGESRSSEFGAGSSWPLAVRPVQDLRAGFRVPTLIGPTHVTDRSGYLARLTAELEAQAWWGVRDVAGPQVQWLLTAWQAAWRRDGARHVGTPQAEWFLHRPLD